MLFRMNTDNYSLIVCSSDLFFRRASYAIKLRYGINKPELKTLCSLYRFTLYKGREIVGWKEFTDSHTGNLAEKMKMQGYLRGLFRLQLLGSYEYVHQPGSFSVGITDLGHKIISAYIEALRVIDDNHPVQEVLNNRSRFRVTHYDFAA